MIAIGRRAGSVRLDRRAKPHATKPAAMSSTLIFCDQVIPAKTVGSSLRSDSIGQRVSGNSTIKKAITSPGRCGRRAKASSMARTTSAATVD